MYMLLRLPVNQEVNQHCAKALKLIVAPLSRVLFSLTSVLKRKNSADSWLYNYYSNI